MKGGSSTGARWTTASRTARKVRNGALAFSALGGVVVAAACSALGNGTPPPPNIFYYPTGLTVSAGGSVLYVANSDFDLQYSAGTIQSYDLTAIRNDTVALILGMFPLADGGLAIPFDASGLDGSVGVPQPLPFDAGVAASYIGCPNTPLLIDDASAPTNPNDPDGYNNQPGRLPIGQGCAPPMDNTYYFRDAVTIGAFATDIQLSKNKGRLFAPVRGSATITWIDVQNDSALDGGAPGRSGNADVYLKQGLPSYLPFDLHEPLAAGASVGTNGCFGGPGGACPMGCGASAQTQNGVINYLCDEAHNAGQLGDYGNTRQVTMPGEPFAMALSEDGTAIALTQQTETESSLFLSGFIPEDAGTYPLGSGTQGSDDAGVDAASDGAVADAGAVSDASRDSSVVEAGAADSGTEGVDAGAGTQSGSEDAGELPANYNSASLGTNTFPTSIQFVVQNMPLGGDGMVAIPHDLAAIPTPDPANPLRPAFLQTNNQSAEIDLLRYYSDEGYQQNLDVPPGTLEDAGVAVAVGSSNLRPFLIKERIYSVSVGNNATNSRGIAIDPTPRIYCEQTLLKQGVAVTDPRYVTCAQTPARVFIASRSPNSLVFGQIGGTTGDGTYDPDQLTIFGNYPLSAGPSNVYVAPIVDQNGNYAVRIFVVCFDSQTIAIWNPDENVMENVVTTGPGPFAMAFDPFDITEVAMHAPVLSDPRSEYMTIVKGAVGGPALKRYRFAYIASFTDSYLQVMDLDQSFRDDRLGGGQSTFETMVYTLGVPTQPVGSN